MSVSRVPALAKIVIRILNPGKPDDVLIFRPDTESTGFNVSLQQNTVGTFTEFYIEYDNVVKYLDAFFRSVNMDIDLRTGAQVQVEVPGLPCVLLKKRDLLPYLFSVIEEHLLALQESDVWPLESKC